MKKFGIRIKNVRLKDGKIETTHKTPKPLRKGKFQKAAREEKKWKAKGK